LPTLEETSMNSFAVCSTRPDPSFTRLTVPSMRPAVFLAASAARMARFLTSSATTANPAPASPARAASTAALSASRLVWKAISSIVLMILEVSSLAREISPIDVISFSMDWPALATVSFVTPIMEFAWSALLAFCLVMDDISSREEDVSSMEAACSEAPSAIFWLDEDRTPAAIDTSSTSAFRSNIALSIGLIMERTRKYPTVIMNRPITRPAMMTAEMTVMDVFSSMDLSLPMKTIPAILPSAPTSGQ